MKRELEEQLYKDFPQLFQDRDKPDTETLMCYGCACGDGWYNLIYKTCEKLMVSNPSEDFRFFQIKEKFGGLRLYTTSATDEQYKILNEAEQKAYTICEWCGSKENITINQDKSWLHSLCPKCHEKRKAGYRH